MTDPSNKAKPKQVQSNSAPATATISPEGMLSKLRLGALIQVSTPDGSIKYLTRLIGADGCKTLITALPSPKQLKKETVGVVYDNVFFADKVLVMRLITEGSVFAFESNVVAVNYSGCKLLLSSFPQQIQSQVLRQDARFPCALSCQGSLQEQAFTGVMVDISYGGGQLLINPQGLNLAHDKLKGLTLPLRIRFDKDKPADELETTIVSVQKINPQDMALGLAFTQSEKSVNAYLASLQLEDMSALFL